MTGFLVIASVTIFTWFITSTVKNLGHIPSCVSDSYYALDTKGDIFVIIILLTSALMLPVLVPFGKLIGFLTCAGLACVGFCPKFRGTKIQRGIHYGGALIAMIGSQILTFRISPTGFLAWVPVILWYGWVKLHEHSQNCKPWEKELFDKTDWLWWLEIGSFYSIWLSLLIR